MGGEWVERTIGEIADVVGGSTPSTKDPSNFDGDIPWLTPKDLSGVHPRYVSRGARNLSRKGLESCSAQLIPRNSILLSTRAPIGYVAIAANPIATNQGFRSLVLKEGYDHEFVYYWLKSNIPELERHASGSTFKELSGSALKQIRIRLPRDKAEQRAIARALGTLDDKIELNRRMNETLEAMAEALFKSWFVDFDPVVVNALKAGNPIPEKFAKRAAHYRDSPDRLGLPEEILRLFPARFVDSELGPIPEGWETIPLARAFEIQDGKPLPKAKRVVRGRYQVFGANGPIARTDETLVESACIVLGKIGSCGSLHRSEGPCWVTNNAFIVREGNSESLEFAWFTLKSIDFKGFVGGSANPYMPKKSFAHHKIVFPPTEIIEQFQWLAGKLRTMWNNYQSQIEMLATLRDTLLPKLISGELRVPDVEKILEDVT